MAAYNQRLVLGKKQYIQKPISKKLIKVIQMMQAQLQREENIKHGRKALSVSFVYSSDELARRLLK